MFEYWQRQGDGKILYPEVDTWAPEQKRFAGKMLIIGGNRGAFYGVAKAMERAFARGVGEVRAVLPESLKKTVPAGPEMFFVKAEASGAFGGESLAEIFEQISWAEAVLFVGDVGKNAETALALGEILQKCEKPVYLTRDVVDAVCADAASWTLREAETTVVASMAQLQKVFRALYYPKMITLSMPMNQLVETLHKFSLSFGLCVMTVHEGMLVVAKDGKVITQKMAETVFSPVTVFEGALATDAAILRMWNAAQGVEKCVVTAWVWE